MVWWAPLITGLTTGLLAVGGVLWAQWRADRREATMRPREQRNEAYVAFLVEADRALKGLIDPRPGAQPSAIDLLALHRRVVEIQLFGTNAAHQAAQSF
jgi:hypothetical protein